MAIEKREQSRSSENTILIISHEPRSQRLLRMLLEPAGYKLVTPDTALAAADMLDIYYPDLILLDFLLPGMDAFELCHHLRSLSSVPIVVVAASSEIGAQVRMLDLGADDYVTKPYDPLVFVARVGAVLRRNQRQPAAAVFRNGELNIDLTHRQVFLTGKEILLTGKEYQILERLAQNAGRMVAEDTLLRDVWGSGDQGNLPSLHLYISRLMYKLGDNLSQSRFILAGPGRGYQMVRIEQQHQNTRQNPVSDEQPGSYSAWF
jgi:two-component system, OmpR family, KDP operon response regulator KdpE